MKSGIPNFSITVLIGLSFGLIHCSNFQGPGDFQGPGSFADERKVELRTGAPVQFYWPVRNARVSQPYSPKHNADHEGIDIGGWKGLPIYSAAAGKVIYTGKDFKGYGLMVIVEHNDEWATLYGHFSKIKVQTGQHVDENTIVGLMGRTGRATGVHLHFEILRNKQPVDPQLYLPEHD